jgi:trk system potassium uptake protein TrkH
VRHAVNELRRMLHPQAIFALRHNGVAVAPGVLGTALAVLWFSAAALLAGALGLALLGLEPFAALAMSAGALSNTGSAVGGVSPVGGYAALPSGGKWILIFCMLLGRLELVTVLALCTPDFWRRSQ